MIDRTRRFQPLTTIAAVALALCTVLDVCVRPAHAQTTEENFPCSVRDNAQDCMLECNTGTFFSQCLCMWDPREMLPEGGQCPEGKVCCWNIPCEKNTDEVACLRGGGSIDGTTPKNCSWTADDECVCTPPLVNAGYTVMDFDMDSSKLFAAPFDCLCPFTTVEQWLRLGVCNPPAVSKLGIKLNFGKPANDSIGLKGTLAVPDGFAVGGATLEVSIGGVVKTFTLDAKGKATVGTDQAKLTVTAKKGVVAAQDAKLSIKLTKGSFASSLSDDGLVDATVTNVALSVPVEIEFNGTMYAKTHAQTYTAKTGKSGATKDPK